MKVLIVGGGFAGIKAARSLAADPRMEVTLVSDRDHFEYHAALYRSATGRSSLEVVVPLAQIFASSRVKVVQDGMAAVDADDHVAIGRTGTRYTYDVLVLALGVVTEYYGIRGLADFSYGIKNIDEAERLKAHLHSELAAGRPDSHYVVVGGGPTGVELAGELVAYLAALRRAHRVKSTKFTVHLVEAAPRVLPAMPKDISAKITKRLQRLGVQVHVGTAVKGETADSISLPSGKLKTHLVVWTAGVTNNPFFTWQAVFKLGKGKRVVVDDQLRAAPDVYVLGDSAATTQTGWAQTALYDADFVATNLKRGLDGQPARSYHPRQPVGAIPVGPRWCAVAMGNRRLYGYPGWVVRRHLDLKLFRRLLPAPLARQAWLFGSKREESCPTCAKALRATLVKR